MQPHCAATFLRSAYLYSLRSVQADLMRRAALLPCPIARSGCEWATEGQKRAMLLLRIFILTLRRHPGLDPGSILAWLNGAGVFISYVEFGKP